MVIFNEVLYYLIKIVLLQIILECCYYCWQVFGRVEGRPMNWEKKWRGM